MKFPLSWRFQSSAMWCHVHWHIGTNVLEESSAFSKPSWTTLKYWCLHISLCGVILVQEHCSLCQHCCESLKSQTSFCSPFRICQADAILPVLHCFFMIHYFSHIFLCENYLKFSIFCHIQCQHLSFWKVISTLISLFMNIPN
jgi:hypothetical protein